MALNNLIREKVILPASDIFLGKYVYRHLEFLNRSQWWSKEELVNFQNQKLRELVHHVYYNVPFYNRIFNELGIKPFDIKTQADLTFLPILSKDMIKSAVKNGELRAENIPPKELVYNSSSGSTGEPLQFYESRLSESLKKASAIRGWYWMGYRLGDKFVKVSQIPRKGVLKKVQDSFARSLYLHISQLNDQSFQMILNAILGFKAKYLRIYPDPLGLLVSYMKRNNIKINSIKAINTTGSILTPEVREAAEEVFKCKIFDGFSCEGGAVAFECSTHNCYHSAMEYAITEVLDKDGNNTKNGRLVTTDLWNYTTPFIRYDTQDIVELEGKSCTCGRELLSIKRILGRESDILVTPSGQYLIVNNFTGHFQWIKEVEQFQIHQIRLDSFDIYLKVNSGYNAKTESTITDLLNGIIKDKIEINFKVVDDIPSTKAGKRRFLIRNNDIKLPNNY